MRHRRTAAACISAAALAISLAACSNDGIEANDGPDQTADTEAGQFTGPWAPLLTQVYQNAESEFTRRVLEDGVVSDQELVEMWQLILECTHAAGWTDVTITTTVGPTGVSPVIRFGQTFDDAMHEDHRACVARYDGGDPNDFANAAATLRGLSSAMRFNPDGPVTLDQRFQLTLGCLQRQGLLPEGMTVAEYDLWMDPCQFPRTPDDTDRLERAKASGCFAMIVPLDGRDGDEVKQELTDQGLLASIRSTGFNEYFFIAYNPDWVDEAPILLDGSALWDNAAAQLCFINPDLDYSELLVPELGAADLGVGDAYDIADCGAREPVWSRLPMEWWLGAEFLAQIEAAGIGNVSLFDTHLNPEPFIGGSAQELRAWFHVGEGLRPAASLARRAWDESGNDGTMFASGFVRWCDCRPIFTSVFDFDCRHDGPEFQFAHTPIGEELAALYGELP